MLLLGDITKHMRITSIVILLLPLAVFEPIHASADSGSGSQAPPTKQFSSRDFARANAKHALAIELSQVREGHASAKFNKDLAAFLSNWGPATFASPRLLAIPMDPTPSSRALPVTQYPELSPAQYCLAGAATCYCGPSAAETVLQYLQPTSHDNEVLVPNGDYSQGQYGLAGIWGAGNPYSWKYLETNVAHGSVPGGETPWFSGGTDYPMPLSFNYWVSGAYQGFPNYVAYRPTSLSDYQGELLADIGNTGSGFPLAADIEEVAGGLHLPGHPQSLEIQHWIALYGYTSRGVGTDYVEPVAGSALTWPVVAYNVGYDSNSIFTLVTAAGPNGGPYGIVW